MFAIGRYYIRKAKRIFLTFTRIYADAMSIWSVLNMWGLFNECGSLHIVPINDIKDHMYSLTCDCNPTVTIADKGFLVVHNAWDGRE